ncbi:HdeD family acid-resistance protein [Rhodoplanes elegans]|uniref:HdeD family acid-resistance protein n=1 Tax=Rhodoplanes elegans TaxID=29408 RepID=UPI0011B94C6E|nr:HdeD family acid-resistance protein [Rhodoplanes elegans]
MASEQATAPAIDTLPAPVPLRFRWWSFLLLGLVLLVCGSAAIALPVTSTMAAGLVLGTVLVIVGIAKIVQAFETKGWPGFVWQLLGGGVEIVGGVLVYFNPLKGAVAITLLIAIVFVVLGLSQIGCAVKIRRQRGAFWLLVSGLVALLMSLVLVFKFPHVRELEAGVVAGVSLVISGLSYVAIALAIRKAFVAAPPA